MQWGLAGGEGVTGLKSYTSKDGIRLPSGRAGAYQVAFQAHELTILPSEFWILPSKWAGNAGYPVIFSEIRCTLVLHFGLRCGIYLQVYTDHA